MLSTLWDKESTLPDAVWPPSSILRMRETITQQIQAATLAQHRTSMDRMEHDSCGSVPWDTGLSKVSGLVDTPQKQDHEQNGQTQAIPRLSDRSAESGATPC